MTTRRIPMINFRQNNQYTISIKRLYDKMRAVRLECFGRLVNITIMNIVIILLTIINLSTVQNSLVDIIFIYLLGIITISISIYGRLSIMKTLNNKVLLGLIDDIVMADVIQIEKFSMGDIYECVRLLGEYIGSVETTHRLLMYVFFVENGILLLTNVYIILSKVMG